MCFAYCSKFSFSGGVEVDFPCYCCTEDDEFVSLIQEFSKDFVIPKHPVEIKIDGQIKWTFLFRVHFSVVKTEIVLLYHFSIDL